MKIFALVLLIFFAGAVFHPLELQAQLNPPTDLIATPGNNSVDLMWLAPISGTELAYDDGTVEGSITIGAGSDGDLAVRFTPNVYPSTLLNIKVWFGTTADTLAMHHIDYTIWDGTSAGPGTALATGPQAINRGGFDIVDVSSHNVQITADDFFISYYEPTDSVQVLGWDTGQPSSDRSWVHSNSIPIPWTTTGSIGPTFDNDYMIRAIVQEGVGKNARLVELSPNGASRALSPAEIKELAYQRKAQGINLNGIVTLDGTKIIEDNGNNSAPIHHYNGSLRGIAGLQSYNIYRSDDGTTFSQIGSVDSTMLTYTDNTVTNGTTYWYYVTAVYDGMESGPSNTVPATPFEGLTSLTHTPGDLNVGIFNDGSIGADNVNFVGPGVSWKGQNGIFVGGPVFGTAGTGSVNGLVGSFSVAGDLINKGSNFVGGFTSETDFNQVTEAKLNDSGAPTPYQVDIVQKSYSNTGDNFVFIRYGFVNQGASDLTDFYAGIFVDWDVDASTYTTNQGGYSLNENLVYQFDAGATPYYYGIVVADGLVGYKSTTDSPVPSTREGCFTWISTPDMDPILPPGDFRCWQGGGPETIAPGDTLWRTFAVVAGDDLPGIQTNAAAAMAEATAQGWLCTPGLLGDANGDDAVNSTDALVLLSYDAGLTLPQSILDRIADGFGDVNSAGGTNSTDALIVLSYDAGIPIPFPVGDPVCLPAPVASKSSTNIGKAEKNIDAFLKTNSAIIKGRTIDVPVTVDMSNSSEELGSYTMTLQWDPSRLQLQSYSGGTTEGFSNPVVNDALVSEGKLIAAHAYPYGADGKVNILNLQFKVIGNIDAFANDEISMDFSAMAAAKTFTNLLPNLEIAGAESASEADAADYSVDNYPNPFNPTTTVSFFLPSAQTVNLKVYNVLGQQVGTLISNRRMEAGAHRAVFDASNLPSGIYYYRIKAGDFVSTQKMMLLK